MTSTTELSENTFTHSGDQTTFYWSAGPINGPLVILIHGWPANGETWKPQLAALAALGFRAIAPDCRGYGRSSVPRGARAYALEHHVADMQALLQHLGRAKALWIGHDWGAGLAWALAAHRPDACVAVCCMAVPYACVETGLETLVALSNRDIYPEADFPNAQWDYQKWHEESPEESARQLERNVAGSLKKIYARGSSAGYGKASVWTGQTRKNGGWWGGKDRAPDSPFEETLFKDDVGMYERMVAEFEKNGFEGPNAYYLNHDVNAEYTKKAPNGGYLHFPVLFIGARWDSVCDTSNSRLTEPMRELCKDLTECTIDAGHWVALEKPQETNAAIVRWIATKLPSYFPHYWNTPFVSKI